MDDFLAAYAMALTARLGIAPTASTGNVAAPDENEVLLLLARLVAHRTERRNAPLATYLAGQFAAARAGGGGSAAEAAAEALEVAEQILGPLPSEG